MWRQKNEVWRQKNEEHYPKQEEYQEKREIGYETRQQEGTLPQQLLKTYQKITAQVLCDWLVCRLSHLYNIRVP